MTLRAAAAARRPASARRRGPRLGRRRCSIAEVAGRPSSASRPPIRSPADDARAAEAPDLDSPFPQCFVCGHARGADGLHIHAGPRRGPRRSFAATWTSSADASARSSSGRRSTARAPTRPACWVAAWSCSAASPRGSIGCRRRASAASSSRWPLGSEGRKHAAGTALFADGRRAARASRAPSGSSRAAERTSPRDDEPEGRRRRANSTCSPRSIGCRYSSMARAAAAEAPDQASSSGDPVGGVVHMAEPVDVGRTQRPRRCSAPSAGRQLEPRRGAPARRGGAVDREEALAEAQRPQVVVEMDPDALGLDAPPRVAAQRVAARGRRAGDAAAPRLSSTARSRGTARHVELGSAHDPDVLVRRQARVGHVVGRDVLQVARDSIEPETAVRVGVREANRPPRVKRAAHASIRRTRPRLPRRPRHALLRRDARTSWFDLYVAMPSRSSSSQSSSRTPLRTTGRGGARRTAAGRRRAPAASRARPGLGGRARRLTSRRRTRDAIVVA